MTQSREALRRLGEFLANFEACFLRRDQRGSVLRYVDGLLGPSERKNLRQMWERLESPGHYQSLQHVITHSTWNDEKVWKTLRATIPERRGILIADDTGLPKQGKYSVGVHRQYSGTLGKIGNCQVAVSAALRGAASTWLLAMDLYLPEAWTKDPDRCARAGIPEEARYQPKWRISLTQIEKIRRAGFEIECVVADAGYGDTAEYRLQLARKGLSYLVGIRGTTGIWTEPPRFVEPKKKSGVGRPRTRRLAKNVRRPDSISDVARSLSASAWRTVRWRNGTGTTRRGVFAALRVTPSHDWRKWFKGRRNPECWLLIERRSNETKYYLSNLPPETPILRLVELAKARWAVEKNYRDLKNEVGFDHFAGRRWDGWHHHVVLAAVTYTFLELERRRKSSSKDRLTLPAVRNFVRRILTSMWIIGDKEFFEDLLDLHRDPPKRIWT